MSDLVRIHTWFSHDAADLCFTEHGRRHIKMDDKFFLGYRKTAVKPEEVLVSVLLPFTVKVGDMRKLSRSPKKICLGSF